ncbi:MAG: UDP-N-acetylmuramate dehydrogenase [Acidobacteria bacterium]|nr:UDP-N-acetylmuramate dehydrogenase [Acidobacteriota bacterium]
MTPRSDVALAEWCTMGVGGPARWFVEARTESDVCNALAWARARRAVVHVLGGGSNVVMADAGFDGLVIKVDLRGVASSPLGAREIYSAGAGEPWDPFVAVTVAGSCAGLECLSGIPGQVGGTPVQNVGAYGQDVSGCITRVHAVDRRTLQPTLFSNAACHFRYRTSAFKREGGGRYVITRVEYALERDAPPTIAYADIVNYFEQRGETSPSVGAAREATLDIRRRKGMVIEADNPANRSCGSFFVNPLVSREQYATLQANAGSAVAVPHYVVDECMVKIPAAWLIEGAGFTKGSKRGAVGISPFQAQAIVNHGGATAADVLSLAAAIKRAVLDAYAIAIVPEPVFVGFKPSAALQWLLDPDPHN